MHPIRNFGKECVSKKRFFKHGALLPEFSELPYDHGSQAIAWRILVADHVLENGVEQGQIPGGCWT